MNVFAESIQDTKVQRSKIGVEWFIVHFLVDIDVSNLEKKHDKY